MFNYQKKYSDEISRLRYLGNIDGAINKCSEALSFFPENNFFYKILGDLFAQKGDFENAGKAYINQLKLIGDKPEQFKNFARFHQLLEQESSDFIEKFHKLIIDKVQAGEIPANIKEKLVPFLGPQSILDRDTLTFLEKTNDDQNLRQIIKKMDTIKDKDTIRAIINWRISAEDRAKSHKIDDFFVAFLEKNEMYSESLKLIKKIIESCDKPNPTIIRTLFRICRKQNDYSIAESLFKIDSQFILNSDFNIQYELVYYFEHNENETLLDNTFKMMRTSANNSIPISRTLYNFYLKFNRFENAKEISEHIRDLESSKKNPTQVSRINEQFESEQGIWDKLQDLVSEQEHNRQMIAMRELLKGFSHELGQPITNIRYSTQLYKIKAQKGALTENSIDELINVILSQTNRIGKLLARFRPIVSSKSKDESFNVFDRINSIFIDLSARLEILHIEYSLQGDRNVQLWGDPIQFDQVFYNLILNSMQAISGVQQSGKIDVRILGNANGDLRIYFSDTGPGIAKENTKKIFEPFYTTKDPSSQNGGGEGLGLFIVWNVLKMFNGSIKVDIHYKIGAKFIITIKPMEVNSNE